MSTPAGLYAQAQMEFLPSHFDEQTRQLIFYMLKETYDAGHSVGYSLGIGTGKGIAMQLLHDMMENLQSPVLGEI